MFNFCHTFKALAVTFLLCLVIAAAFFLPGRAYADGVSLPVFPEALDNYVVVQNSYFPDEFWLILSSDDIEVRNFANDGDYGYCVYFDDVEEGRAVLYHYVEDSYSGWRLSGALEYPGSSYYWWIKFPTVYADELKSLVPGVTIISDHIWETSVGDCSKPLATNQDLPNHWEGWDNQIQIDFYERSDDPLQNALNYTRSSVFKLLAFMTSHWLPICIGILSMMVLVTLIVKVFGRKSKVGFVSYRNRNRRRSNMRASKPRYRSKSYRRR